MLSPTAAGSGVPSIRLPLKLKPAGSEGTEVKERISPSTSVALISTEYESLTIPYGKFSDWFRKTGGSGTGETTKEKSLVTEPSATDKVILKSIMPLKS